MQYKRLMGIDFGEKRIGIAFSDPLNIISSAYEVYHSKSEDDGIDHICKLIKDFNVETIAFGLPLNMDGTEGDRALRHKQIADKISSLSGAKIVYIDERLTSVEAEELLKESGMKWEKRKEVIDKVSAQIILQTYMNSKK